MDYKEFGIAEKSVYTNFAAFRSGKIIPGSQHLQSEQFRNSWEDFFEALQIDKESVSDFHNYPHANLEYKKSIANRANE